MTSDLWHCMTQAEILNKLFINEKRYPLPTTDRLNQQGLEIHFAYLWRSKVQNFGCRLSRTKSKRKAVAAFAQLCVLKTLPPDYTSAAVSHSINRARHGARTQELASPVFLCFLLNLIYLNISDSDFLLFEQNDPRTMTSSLLWYTDLNM